MLEKTAFIDSFYMDKTPLEKAGFNPYYLPVTSGLGRKIKIDRKELICFGSNDYLGLSNSREIKKQAGETLKKFGLSMCATAIVAGHTSINRMLEEKIARFLKQDDAIAYPSCYQCNTSLFQLLASPSDIIIADKNIHSSLIHGALLSKARLKFFPHNDIPRLKRILSAPANNRMRFIVLEGLYSTDGDTALLDEISKLAKQFDAFIIIDDAHGVGVLGKEGRGILEKYNSYKDVGLISGSLGKAIGAYGGFLAGNGKIIDYFRYNCGAYIYSTALPAHICAAAASSLDIILKRNDLRLKIYGYKEKLYGALSDMGYKLTKSLSPLFSVLFNDTAETLKMARLLFENKIYAVAFIPPSVPRKAPRIRLLTSAYLLDEDIDTAIKVFSKLKDKIPIRKTGN